MPRLVPARVEVDAAALVEIQRRLSIAEAPDLPGAACRGMSDVERGRINAARRRAERAERAEVAA